MRAGTAPEPAADPVAIHEDPIRRAGAPAGQGIPVEEEIAFVDLCCHGALIRADVFERIIRSGPERILGNQLKRFHYAVASEVFIR